MPYCSAVCGVMPNCANTGMPARTRARTVSGKSAAPSSLIMSAPPSLTMRMAARRALILGHLAADRHVAVLDHLLLHLGRPGLELVDRLQHHVLGRRVEARMR